MKRIITLYPPEALSGPVRLPASKSISNRVLILNALSRNSEPVENLSDSDDTVVLQKALLSQGPLIDIGAAGTAMRFLTAYLTLQPGEWVLTGSERMKKRPIRVLTEALSRLGASLDFLGEAGYPPLKICGGRPAGGTVRVDGGISSQYISALMMIAPCLEKGISLELEGIVISEPYIRMTAWLMEQYGVVVIRERNAIRIGCQKYHPIPFRVENDWSAASYWYEMIALGGAGSSLVLPGLDEGSLQGDAVGCFLFEKLGVRTEFVPEGVRLTKATPYPFWKKGEAFVHDFISEPDLAQTFVVSCCLLDIPFRFTGLQSLRIKETDRIAALQNELLKLGYVVSAEEDATDGNMTMRWNGRRCSSLADPLISTYEDHRMALAFAPVALKRGKIRIEDPDVVTKSYPGYWKELERVRFRIISESEG